MSGDFWTDDELARFGKFELDGVPSPGIVTGMTLDGTPLKWDSQNGFGLSGEFLRYTGLGLASFSFQVRLVDGEDRAAVDSAAWRRAAAPPAQGQADRKRAIRHPVLERHRTPVNFCVMLDVPFEVPQTTEGGGVLIEYKFKAHRKPLPVPVVPKSPENAAAGKVPQNPRQAAIEALTAQVAALRAKGAAK